MIRRAENVFVFTTWLLLAIVQILILPVHMLSMVVTRGCDGAVQYMSEVQALAVQKMKAAK